MVEKDPQALISKRSSTVDPRKKEPTMVENKQPNKPATSNITTAKDEQKEEYITEYVCFCIPKKRKVVRQETNVSLTSRSNHSLDEKLLNQ
mmetsp:Transcript_25438/g.22451  ORF Transcript_25438/g.22451 Transcript_25438/m.22451 type:complete len:91 (-) Transcript_25438:1581-1853(-)